MGSDSIIGNRGAGRQNASTSHPAVDHTGIRGRLGRRPPSTVFEFNDFINSLKSFDRSMLGYQLKQDIKTLLRGKRPIESPIRIVGVLERVEDADLLLLRVTFSL
jgi:hypothetical protein